MTSEHSVPKISVLSWNTLQVQVRCPYCESIHHHGLSLPGRRISHCLPGGEYEFLFPIDFDKGLVGFEIDKKRAAFVTTRLSGLEESSDGTSTDDDGDGDLAAMFQSKLNVNAPERDYSKLPRLIEDAKEMINISISESESFEQKRMSCALSDYVTGKLSAVEHYLETSNESELFLRGRDHQGNTTLILAGAERCSGMVQLLLNKGVEVDAVNKDGRSALMESALWGRVDSVKVLLTGGANRSVRDRNGRSALDLAQATRTNEVERRERCLEASVENNSERDADRRHIAILLRADVATPYSAFTAPILLDKIEQYTYRRSRDRGTVTLCGPLQDIPVSSPYKTVAHLNRGSQFPIISATSGWAPGTEPFDEPNRPSWVDQVSYLASICGHHLPHWPDRDRGRPGQYFACHAEKKLIAYFVDRHLFTPFDKTPDETIERQLCSLKLDIWYAKNSCPVWTEMSSLERKKENLTSQLSDAEDPLVKNRSGSKSICELDREIEEAGRQLSISESDLGIAGIRKMEQAEKALLIRAKPHRDLMSLSEQQPQTSLKRATILTSNKICEDCDSFKALVNTFFGISITLDWRV